MPVDPEALVALSALLSPAADEVTAPSPAPRAATAHDEPVQLGRPPRPAPPAAASTAPAPQAPTVQAPSPGAPGDAHLTTEAAPRAGLPSMPTWSRLGLGTLARPSVPPQLREWAATLHLPDLGTFPTVDADARRRLALLAGSSVVAGLACGLAVPTAAEAAEPTAAPATTTNPDSLLAPSASPFADLPAAAAAVSGAVSEPAPPATAKPAAPKPAAAKPAAAKPAAAKPAAAKPAAAKPAAAKPAAPKPVVATPVAAAAATPQPSADEPATAVPAPGLPAAAEAPGGSGVARLLTTSTPFDGLVTASAPAAPGATAVPSPAASLPGRTTARSVAVVPVIADPLAPHPGRRAAVVPAVAPGWKVTRPLPANSGKGRRIVYAERAAHLWIVGADGQVLRDYKVTGRKDRPGPGTYRVFSKSKKTSNPEQKLTFDLMVRFTRGVTGAPIGFHTIPKTYAGTPIQSEKDLGRAIGMGGCVRQARVDAEWLYAWSRVGDAVVVLR